MLCRVRYKSELTTRTKFRTKTKRATLESIAKSWLKGVSKEKNFAVPRCARNHNYYFILFVLREQPLAYCNYLSRARNS